MTTFSNARRRALVAAGATAFAVAAPPSWAQAFPSKPIRMIMPFAPGGAADVVTRIIAKGLEVQLKQPVVMDNKPGGDGIVAAQELFRAPPDGHTLMMGTNTALVAVPITRNPAPYDPFKMFTPISTAGEFSMFLAVNPSIPSGSAKEFLDHLAANPGKYNSASSNSAAELAMLQLLATRKSHAVNARYRGDVQAMQDLVGGQVQMMFSTGTLTPNFVKDGKVKALMTLLPNRSPLLPDVPTAAELGFGRLTIVPWAGFFAPAGTPPDVVERLNAGLRAAMAAPDVKEQLAAQGFFPYGMPVNEFQGFLRARYDDFATIIKEGKVKFD
jgi:tripartite-type tricarboxylate transporter receptor subunit TctC